MTKDQVQVVNSSFILIVRALLASLLGQVTADDIMDGNDPITEPAVTSMVGKFVINKALFDANPDTFVATPASVDLLDDVVDALTAVSIQDFAVISGSAYDALQTASPD